MPAVYSLDLRERVVAAVDAGEGTQPQIATRFAVSLGWVEKLLRQRRRTGHIAPLGHRGEPRAAWTSPPLPWCARPCTPSPTWPWRNCGCG